MKDEAPRKRRSRADQLHVGLLDDTVSRRERLRHNLGCGGRGRGDEQGEDEEDAEGAELAFLVAPRPPHCRLEE